MANKRKLGNKTQIKLKLNNKEIKHPCLAHYFQFLKQYGKALWK